MDDQKLRAKFAECTERMRRVWDEAPPEAGPEYRFHFSFTAERPVGEIVKAFIAGSPTKDRTYRFEEIGGGRECRANRT